MMLDTADPRGVSGLWLGAGLIVLGELMFASMGVCIRLVADSLPNESVVFFRNLIGLALILPWLMRRSGGGMGTRVPHLHLLRGLAGVGAMYCFFYAIAHIQLAEAMLLKLTAPLFIPLVALLWLGEAVIARVWLAVAVGFAGVLVILHGGLEGVPPVALIGLLGGLLAAVAKVTVRRLSRTEPAVRIVFYFACVGTLVSSAPLLWAWRTPALEDLPWLLGVGLLATLGQLCLTKGLSLAPAARMGAFAYFAVIFGAAYGWLLWDEHLMWWTVAGSLLILLSGLLAGSRDRPAPAIPATGPIRP
jgi:drug/metabolite transporter (DMT)-like permease